MSISPPPKHTCVSQNMLPPHKHTVCGWPILHFNRRAVTALLLFGLCMATLCTRSTLLAVQHESRVAALAVQLAAQNVQAVRSKEAQQAQQAAGAMAAATKQLDTVHKQATATLGVVAGGMCGGLCVRGGMGCWHSVHHTHSTNTGTPTTTTTSSTTTSNSATQHTQQEHLNTTVATLQNVTAALQDAAHRLGNVTSMEEWELVLIHCYVYEGTLQHTGVATKTTASIAPPPTSDAAAAVLTDTHDEATIHQAVEVAKELGEALTQDPAATKTTTLGGLERTAATLQAAVAVANQSLAEATRLHNTSNQAVLHLINATTVALDASLEQLRLHSSGGES